MAQYTIPQDRRYLYGMKSVEVYASSNPSGPSTLAVSWNGTWDPIKHVSAIGTDAHDTEFIAIYESLHDDILSSILTTLPDGDWGLNVLRLGFDDTDIKERAITIHLVVGPDVYLSYQMASQVVSDILAIIAAAPSSNQPIHVDVCRAMKYPLNSKDNSFSLLDRNPEVYESPARLPYSSLGPANHSSAGTLSMFINHYDDSGRVTKYVLTCRHVINPRNVEFAAGKATSKISVTSPAKMDHDQTIHSIEADIAINGSPMDEIITLKQNLKNANKYEIHLGEVIATSGIGRILPDSRGRSDWAIISIDDSVTNFENKYVRSSGSFSSFKHPLTLPKSDVQYLREATQYFAPGPLFKDVEPIGDIPKVDDIFFKPRSRTTNEWVAGTFNGIRSTQSCNGVQTREFCFITFSAGVAMSAEGDSGSIIVDKKFRPVAMIWGESTHGYAQGPRDVTYASPLIKIWNDIEHLMGGKISML